MSHCDVRPGSFADLLAHAFTGVSRHTFWSDVFSRTTDSDKRPIRGQTATARLTQTQYAISNRALYVDLHLIELTHAASLAVGTISLSQAVSMPLVATGATVSYGPSGVQALPKALLCHRYLGKQSSRTKCWTALWGLFQVPLRCDHLLTRSLTLVAAFGRCW